MKDFSPFKSLLGEKLRNAEIKMYAEHEKNSWFQMIFRENIAGMCLGRIKLLLKFSLFK